MDYSTSEAHGSTAAMGDLPIRLQGRGSRTFFLIASSTVSVRQDATVTSTPEGAEQRRCSARWPLPLRHSGRSAVM